MIFSILLALTGLTLSSVAIYYSVLGLTAIFAAAFWPIVVMGTSLEISKLVAASWLKANWNRIPGAMKAYMVISVIVLMLITSMGIFGFLSKAHSDQTLVSGDAQSKIAIYDEKIKTAKENIEANRKQLQQMDAAVDQVMARSTSTNGAERANDIRKSQRRDRAALAAEIEENQNIIAKLNEESAPLRAELRKVEAEVGPIKYIAKFVYGDNPDANILEKAVTWVITVIIFVFDPMAILLLLAAQMTWKWRADDIALQTRLAAKIKEDALTQTQQSNSLLAQKEEMSSTESQHTSSSADITASARPVSNTWEYPKRANIAASLSKNNNAIQVEPEIDIDEDAVKISDKVTTKELYQQGKINQLDWETIEELDKETAENLENNIQQDTKPEKSYIVKEQHQQVRKTTK